MGNGVLGGPRGAQALPGHPGVVTSTDHTEMRSRSGARNGKGGSDLNFLPPTALYSLCPAGFLAGSPAGPLLPPPASFAPSKGLLLSQEMLAGLCLQPNYQGVSGRQNPTPGALFCLLFKLAKGTQFSGFPSGEQN